MRVDDQLAHPHAGIGADIVDHPWNLFPALLRDDRHPMRDAGRRSFEQGTREGTQETLIEAEQRHGAGIAAVGAHLQRRPDRGPASVVVGRGDIEIELLDDHRRRHRVGAEKGEAGRLALARHDRADIEVLVVHRLQLFAHSPRVQP